MSMENCMLRHARYELSLLEAQAEKDEDPSALQMQQDVTHDVLEILEVLSKQEHSGGSIGYLLNLVRKCALQQNLSPLTGAEHEWVDHGYCKQNKRYGAVFMKEGENRAYYLDGYVEVLPDGSGSVGGGIPLCYIDFPYTPSTRYMPNMGLIPRAEGEAAPSFENFLFNTKQEVLDFYAQHGVTTDDVESDFPSSDLAELSCGAPVRDE